MQLTDVSKLQQTLQEARTMVPGVMGIAVVSLEGLTIASALQPSLDEDRLVAITASMLDVGQRTSRELELGQLDQVYIRSATGYVVLIPAGIDAVLTAILEKDAKLGLVFLNLRRFAEQIERALAGV
jgi:uncharacterized protein